MQRLHIENRLFYSRLTVILPYKSYGAINDIQLIMQWIKNISRLPAVLWRLNREYKKIKDIDV